MVSEVVLEGVQSAFSNEQGGKLTKGTSAVIILECWQTIVFAQKGFEKRTLHTNFVSFFYALRI